MKPKYRKLTREEAVALFEVGVTVESRHPRREGNSFAEDLKWDKTNEYCLTVDPDFRDYFRVQVE